MLKKRFQKKRLSQIFLKDTNIIHKMIRYANLDPNENVVEIGCGEGVLTESLLTLCKQLFVYEIDDECIQLTKERIQDSPKCTFYKGDVLRVGFDDIPVSTYKVIANIPYHISAKIIKLFIKHKMQVSAGLLMVQHEFAKKLLAKPGDKDYTSFTVFTNYHCDISYLFKVSKTCFSPIPKVDSAVIQILPCKTPRFNVNEDAFFRLVKSAFWGRRKNLMNSMAQSPFLSLDPIFRTIPYFIENPQIRGEKLSLDEFYLIYQQLEKILDIDTIIGE